MEQATTSSPEPFLCYSNMRKEEFKSLILIDKKSRYIVYNGWCYYCEHLKSDSKWKICIIPLICTNVEEDIRKNIFNLNFLNNYYSKLCHELLEMFDQNEEAIDCIQGEYTYSGRDW